MEKKIIICGASGGIGAATNAIDTALTCGNGFVKTDTEPITESQIFIYPNMQVDNYSDLQKRNSQAGWKSGNKYMRNKP